MSNVAARFNVEVAHKFSFFPGLNRNENVSEDVGGVGFDLLFGKGDFYATFHDEVTGIRSVEVPFASTTSMNLRFNSHHL